MLGELELPASEDVLHQTFPIPEAGEIEYYQKALKPKDMFISDPSEQF